MFAEDGLIKPYAPALVEFSRVLDLTWVSASLWVTCEIVGISWAKTETILALLATSIFWISSNHLRLYRSWRISPLRTELARLFLCWVTTLLGVVFIIHTLDLAQDGPRQLPLVWFGLGFSSLAATRMVIRISLRALRIQGRNFRTVAIAGATELGRRVEHNIRHTAWMGLRIVGFFDDRRAADDRTSTVVADICGNFTDLAAKVRQGEIDIVYIALPLKSVTRIKELMNRLSDTTASVYFVPDFSSFDLLGAHWEAVGDLPVINLVGSPFYGMNAAVKRLSDVCIALGLLCVMAIPMLVIALIVRLTSRGPAIFRQRRYGLDGREFMIWKFRTMSVREDESKFSQATKNDPRVTAVGAFLRKTSLDELPQLINVIQGRMSIVGPRPHPVAMNERQRNLVNRYMWRHKVKPGITGWAQVNGYRGETDTLEKIEQRIRLDLEYIDNWSLWMDLKILMRTILTVLKGENAY